jgi:hypothetical protein
LNIWPPHAWGPIFRVAHIMPKRWFLATNLTLCHTRPTSSAIAGSTTRMHDTLAWNYTISAAPWQSQQALPQGSVTVLRMEGVGAARFHPAWLRAASSGTQTGWWPAWHATPPTTGGARASLRRACRRRGSGCPGAAPRCAASRARCAQAGGRATAGRAR